jgi:D-cysteine desulfhydrase
MNALLARRIIMAHLPTPVHYLPRLSKALGVSLFVKRDDLTESVASGNKLRKMEYLLFDAREQNADTLVTCGGIQSNHCRAVAWVAAKAGLRAVLLLRGEPPRDLEGNLLIDRILGAEVHFYSPEAFQDIDGIQASVCDRLKSDGRRPYWIPMGGSNAVGALGYVRMIQEISDTELQFDHIYCAMGSGGTYAGIWIGARNFRRPERLHAIAVCDDTAYFAREVARIRREFRSRYGWNVDTDGAEAGMDDGYVGRGYALNTGEELQQMIRFAGIEGLLLDPVYTLKAFLGMVDHIRRGLIQPGDKVLFVHTGGHYGIFSSHAALGRALDAPSPPG